VVNFPDHVAAPALAPAWRRRTLWVAVLLVAGPVLAGTLVFQLRAPGRGPGVYVETSAHPSIVYALLGSESRSDSDAPAVAITSVGGVQSLFVVGREAVTVDVPPAIKLYLEAVSIDDNSAYPQVVPLPASARWLDAATFQVTSKPLQDTWRPGTVGYDFYQHVLESSFGSRANVEVRVVLELPGATSVLRGRYAVKIGPRPSPSEPPGR
jgi:hypothetical protein